MALVGLHPCQGQTGLDLFMFDCDVRAEPEPGLAWSPQSDSGCSAENFLGIPVSTTETGSSQVQAISSDQPTGDDGDEIVE